jgi:hypothetical protein
MFKIYILESDQCPIKYILVELDDLELYVESSNGDWMINNMIEPENESWFEIVLECRKNWNA